MLSLIQAQAYLKNHLVFSSVAEARYFWEDLQHLSQIYHLFAHFFPDSSLPSDWIEMEMQFYQLVHEHLFPLPFDWLWEEEKIRFHSIPLAGHDFHYEHYECIEETGVQLLLYLSEGSEMRKYRDSQQFPDWACADHLDWQQLESLSAQAEEPLCFLADAISLIDHTTGNLWLDHYCESGFGLDWSIESVESLSHDWIEASRFWAEFDALTEWLEQPTNITKTQTLWNQCQCPP